jgi:hypothetical protein
MLMFDDRDGHALFNQVPEQRFDQRCFAGSFETADS